MILQSTFPSDPTFGGFKQCYVLISFFRTLGFLLAGLFALASSSMVFAQQEDFSIRPIFVTTRIFQIKAKRDSYAEPSSQVFRMSTTSLVEHDQWMKSLKKTYPGFEIDLLRTDARKVFRTSKPTTISLVKQSDGRDIELQMFGAQSIGDGVTPGTTLIPEIALHFGNDQVNKPSLFRFSQWRLNMERPISLW